MKKRERGRTGIDRGTELIFLIPEDIKFPDVAKGVEFTAFPDREKLVLNSQGLGLHASVFYGLCCPLEMVSGNTCSLPGRRS